MTKKDLIEFLKDYPDNTKIKCSSNGQLCDPIIGEQLYAYYVRQEDL